MYINKAERIHVMAEKFPISIWNYNNLDDFTPDEVNVWADCGLTVTMTPRIVYGKDDPAKIIPFLDMAEERGVKLIANVNGLELDTVRKLGVDGYKNRFLEVYNIIKHPALYGFYIGNEPSEKEAFEDSITSVKIQKELAPELSPYLNLHTGMDDTDPELLGGKTFRQWLKDFAKDTGFKVFSYGHYDQVWDENGIDSFFRNIKALVSAANEAGVDCWNTQLSSAHYMFRVPNFYEVTWQITAAAACGSRGINWFRFYDRPVDTNLHLSPIDEYGNKTPLFYDLQRACRRFNDHYGEIIMRCRLKNTYFTNKTYGGYDIFTDRCHPVIKNVRSTEQAIVSFFEDTDGTEYLCIVNCSMTNPGVFRPEFDREKYSLVAVSMNGKQEVPYEKGMSMAHWDGEWLHPGQLAMFRIDHKASGNEKQARAIWSTN